MKYPSEQLRWVRACALGFTSAALAVAGHGIGGGNLEPALIALAFAASVLGAYGWLRTERTLLPIVAWVLTVQVLMHVTLAAGHAHQQSSAMLVAHAASALVLAGFLRFGEARVFAVARRRYLRWVIAVRMALAGRKPVARRPLPWSVRRVAALAGGLWMVPAERGPPVVACC
ncbi:MAG: hypothetical protein MUE31_09675 [Candidatus Nanopelagicales bacterium]|nr:hypothetical protein [Candidatus Nanopelagicales bacterium]